MFDQFVNHHKGRKDHESQNGPDHGSSSFSVVFFADANIAGRKSDKTDKKENVPCGDAKNG